MGSDSGKISISEYDADLNDWKIIHCEVFGKTGCRRIVPGQFLAADPKGRAVIIGALEKQKFVYVMNRDGANRLTVSSPQEAHKADTFALSICGVDVGFENPCFAIIEVEHADLDTNSSANVNEDVEKKLTYYELDLGLNHVVRKWSEPISRTAFLLFTVPGGDDGPSGVLICGENWISYKHQGHLEIRTAIPRRADLPKQKGVLITNGTLFKRKDSFFYLFQSEYGDIYKCSLVLNPEDNKIVMDVVVTVFDTIQNCNALCVSRSSLVFAASEFGNHMLFQMVGAGDDDENAVTSVKVNDEMNETLGDDSESAAVVAPLFTPSPILKNLILADEIPSMAPITDMVIDNMNVNSEDLTPQIHCLCGRGNRSSLRILRHGLAVTEMAVSELPGRPTAVWTVKGKHGEVDKYIIVSFSNATLVLSIGESVQYGIRHIRSDLRISEWKTPQKRPIERCTANSRQVVIALSGGQLIYFELDAAGQLTEVGVTHDIKKDVTSLDLGEIPDGRLKAPFLAVGCCDDSVQILSLESADLLTQRSSMQLPAKPDSLCLSYMIRESVVTTNTNVASNKASTSLSSLYLNVGLSNGVLVRVVVDAVTGSLSDSRQKFLGPKSIKLFRVVLNGNRSVLALSTRSWLLYVHQGRYFQTPLSYDSIEYASNFVADNCPEGIVAIAGDTLRIISVSELGTVFNQTNYPLRYTPRKMCVVTGSSKYLAILESDHNEYNEQEKAKIAAAAASNAAQLGKSANTVVKQEIKTEDEEEEVDEVRIPIRGPIPPMEGKWASCIRIIDPTTGDTKELIELNNNEAAFSICTCRFLEHSEETFIIVGIGRNVNLHPLHCTAAFINVYRLVDCNLQLLHQTEVEELPFALCEFNGRLLVGLGRNLRLYELGKKKLLKKCENKLFPHTIVKLLTHGDRIYVGDVAESMHFVKFKKQESALVIFADDFQPR